MRRLGLPRVAILSLIIGVSLAGIPLVSATDTTAGEITIDHEGETVTVANGSSQVISGTADFRKGTELVVRVRSTGDTEPRFIKNDNAVVTENGTWAVAFNFSAQSAGNTFSVTVMTENGSMSTSLDGEVVACGDSCAEEPPENTPTPRPEQTQTTTTPSDEAVVAFDRAAILVDRGDVATINLLFQNADTATLRLGNEAETGYELVVTVTDANDDGQARLFFDTTRAGRSGQTVSTSTNDSVSVKTESSLSSMLDSGEYPIEVYAGTGVEGEPVSLATLMVQTPDDTTTTNSTVSTAEAPKTSSPLSGLLTGGVGSVFVSGIFLLAGGGLAIVLLRG